MQHFKEFIDISGKPTIPNNASKASVPPANDLIKQGATIGEALGALNEALKEAKRLKGISIS